MRLAVAAYLARFKGQSRLHTESDLRCYLSWCADHDLDPLPARRPHLELYLRWMQEVRGFQPSTVSRRLSVVVGFYRTCVIDAVLEHSPAELRPPPHGPAESPTLGLSHLQFEALLTAARESTNPNDFALVAMLGLLGLRIFEATGADIADLGEEHGHRVLRVRRQGRQGRPAARCHPQSPERSTEPLGDRLDGPILRNSRGPDGPPRRYPPTEAPGQQPPGCRWPDAPPHAPPYLRHHHARRRRDLRDVQIAARHADPRTTMRYDRARKNLDRHPNYILAAYMASGT